MSAQDISGPDDPSGPPAATIIVRAYNQEGIVGDAIQSCFDQTYMPLEIILSDDCSTDGTWEVITSMAGSYRGPHRVITNRNSENLGIVGHTNLTMQMASGVLILSCAGDDIAFPEKTERLVSAWAQQPDKIKAVSSGYVDMSFDGADLSVVSALRSTRRKVEPSALDVVKNNAWCLGAATLWHRDVIDAFGPIPEMARAEDNSLLFRATLIGHARYVDAPLFRKRVGGVSNPTGRPAIEDYFEVAKVTCRNRIATVNAYLHDLGGNDHRQKGALMSACRRRLELLEFERRQAEMEITARRFFLPVALVKAMLRLQPRFLGTALKYSFPNAYIAFRRHRYG